MVNTKGIYGKVFTYSKKIKEKLKIDENTFNNTKFEESDRCFDFWLYSIVDDIYKAGIKSIKEQEIIEGEEIINNGANVEELDSGLNFERYLYENISIEIDMWTRKMTEHLLNLILLKSITEDELENVSKIYFLSLKLKDTLTIINDYENYYGFEHDSGLIEKDFLIEKLKVLLNGKQKPFFIRFNPNKLDNNIKVPNHILESTAELYRKSTEYCENNEKMMLGLTYNRYHCLTQGIHGNGHYRNKDIHLKYCINKYNQLGILLITIVALIFDVKKIQKDDFLSNVNKLEESLENNFKQKYIVGDLVIFKGDLYEIKNVKISEYGYISYLIYRELGDFTNEKYIPQIGIELGITINNFDMIIDQIKDSFKEENFDLFQKMKKDEQFQSIKKVILDLNKNGINIFKKL